MPRGPRIKNDERKKKRLSRDEVPVTTSDKVRGFLGRAGPEPGASFQRVLAELQGIEAGCLGASGSGRRR